MGCSWRRKSSEVWNINYPFEVFNRFLHISYSWVVMKTFNLYTTCYKYRFKNIQIRKNYFCLEFVLFPDKIKTIYWTCRKSILDWNVLHAKERAGPNPTEAGEVMVVNSSFRGEVRICSWFGVLVATAVGLIMKKRSLPGLRIIITDRLSEQQSNEKGGFHRFLMFSPLNVRHFQIPPSF